MANCKKKTHSLFASSLNFPSSSAVFTFLWIMAVPVTGFAEDIASTLVTIPIHSGSSQIYGIFAGMADYPGEENDLELTDQDALRARDALIEGAGMEPENAFTLLNAEATNAN